MKQLPAMLLFTLSLLTITQIEAARPSIQLIKGATAGTAGFCLGGAAGSTVCGLLNLHNQNPLILLPPLASAVYCAQRAAGRQGVKGFAGTAIAVLIIDTGPGYRYPSHFIRNWPL